MMFVPDKKWCRDCEQLLSLERFSSHRRGHLGRYTYCKPCASHRVYESIKGSAAWNPLYFVNRNLWTKYGLRPHEFDAIFLFQKGLCYLCEMPLGTGPRSIHVDHDHACCSGQKVVCGGDCIRGLAHGSCNRGIGHFRDSPVLLERAAANLLRTAA